MAFFWRTSPLTSHEQWFKNIGTKNTQPGTSAPTLADVWAGPLAVMETLESVEALHDFVWQSASVEAQTAFDEHRGGLRNHDLLLTGNAAGGPTVVSIEAKVDERFGETLAAYRDAAHQTIKAGKASNAEARLDGLLDAFAPEADAKALHELRFQLFSGVAGAVAAAVDAGAAHAVFLVHELITDQSEGVRRAENAADLRAFASLVFGLDVPASGSWCRRVTFKGNTRLDPKIALYVGKVTTRLTSDRFPTH